MPAAAPPSCPQQVHLVADHADLGVVGAVLLEQGLLFQHVAEDAVLERFPPRARRHPCIGGPDQEGEGLAVAAAFHRLLDGRDPGLGLRAVQQELCAGIFDICQAGFVNVGPVGPFPQEGRILAERAVSGLLLRELLVELVFGLGDELDRLFADALVGGAQELLIAAHDGQQDLFAVLRFRALVAHIHDVGIGRIAAAAAGDLQAADDLAGGVSIAGKRRKRPQAVCLDGLPDDQRAFQEDHLGRERVLIGHIFFGLSRTILAGDSGLLHDQQDLRRGAIDPVGLQVIQEGHARG